MKLYVVRHGETVWNELHKVQGEADIPLAENGILLAEKTGEALKNVPFDLCFTSPLVRARKTAELILAKHPVLLEYLDQEYVKYSKIKESLTDDSKEHIRRRKEEVEDLLGDITEALCYYEL